MPSLPFELNENWPLMPANSAVCAMCCRCELLFTSHRHPGADIDIVIARGEVATGVKAQRDVVAAGGVAKERVNTVGRVVVAGGVANRARKTDGRVVCAGACCR